MSEYTKEYLNQVAKAIEDLVEADELSYYELDEDPVEVTVGGEKLTLTFKSDRVDAGYYIWCTTFQNEPTDMTIGIRGDYDSWNGTDYNDVIGVVTPRQVSSYVF